MEGINPCFLIRPNLHLLISNCHTIERAGNQPAIYSHNHGDLLYPGCLVIYIQHSPLSFTPLPMAFSVPCCYSVPTPLEHLPLCPASSRHHYIPSDSHITFSTLVIPDNKCINMDVSDYSSILLWSIPEECCLTFMCYKWHLSSNPCVWIDKCCDSLIVWWCMCGQVLLVLWGHQSLYIMSMWEFAFPCIDVGASCFKDQVRNQLRNL